MQARAWTRGNACIYLCVYKYASIIYYYIVLFPIFTYKFSNVTPVLRTWSILLVYYIYIHHARDSILTIFSSKIWPIVFHVQHLFVLPRRRLGEILSTPSQKKKKYIYFDPKKNKIGITRSIKVIDRWCFDRRWKWREKWQLIFSSYLAHHYYFVNVFIPRMVDKVALEARSCFFAFLVTFLWYPPADSANLDSDHSLFLSRRFSHSHHLPPYCSPVPLVAPFYFFSISFDDFETRFSPKFQHTYTHDCWYKILILSIKM